MFHCHNGQGGATNMKEAHGVGRDTYWNKPIIPFVTTYVLSLRSEEVPKKYRRIKGIKTTKKTKDDEAELLYKMYCIACHTAGKVSIYDEVFKKTIPAIMNPLNIVSEIMEK